VTIAVRGTGETFEAQLAKDEFHMLWLVHRNRRNCGRVQILLSAALQTGWRIVVITPAAQALLDAHGSGAEGCSNERCGMVGACGARAYGAGGPLPQRAWTLHKGEHAAAIDFKAVPGIGAEVVLTVDGEWRKARLFRSHEQRN
jgi:hypothetical protein